MDLVEGRLADDQLRQVEEHMTTCSDCRIVVAEAAAASHDDDITAPTQIEVPDSWPSHQPIVPLAAGAGVGRYQVRELIGVGGIGAVYAAHDPELHRMVALKVLRKAALADGGPAGDQRARLLREARAMAQLNHPNVVTVYDAGAFEDQVFLAMELVEGTTLKRWLRAAAHPIDDIVRVFTAAGGGLSAAHRIGLVHRDFKPENVMVGDDGRVRVTDFGLARPVDWEGTGLHRAIGAHGRAWGHATLTRTGVFAGTPAYMAPEQFAGEQPDLRTDQFSFCVALYEAVYRQRPFGGDTLEQIAHETLSGRLRPPPADARVPAPLRNAIARGLSQRRGDRFASMDELLGALAVTGASAGARQRRPGWVPLAGAAVVLVVASVVLAIGLAAWHGTPAQPASGVQTAKASGTASEPSAAAAAPASAPEMPALAEAGRDTAGAGAETHAVAGDDTGDTAGAGAESHPPAKSDDIAAQPRVRDHEAHHASASHRSHRATAAPEHRATAAPEHRATAAPEHRATATPHHPPTEAPAHWVGDGLRDPFATHPQGAASGKESP